MRSSSVSSDVGRLVGRPRRGGEQGLLGLGHLAEDLLLRIEVVVEGPVRQAGLLGDVGDAGLEEAGLLEHLLGRLEQAGPGLRPLPGAARADGVDSARLAAARSWPGRSRSVRAVRSRYGRSVVGRGQQVVERARSSSVRARRSACLDGRQTTPSACQASRRSDLLVDLHARQLRQLGVDADEGRDPLRAEVGLLARGSASNAAGSNVAPSRSSSATITRSPTGSSGTA